MYCIKVEMKLRAGANKVNMRGEGRGWEDSMGRVCLNSP